jgi:DNA-binding NtrC family response regulator
MLPPLRKRKEDIELLTRHFVEMFAREMDKPIRSISSDVFQVLADHDWSGNVRELRNMVQRAVILCNGDILTSDALPETVRDDRHSHARLDVGQAMGFDEREFLCSFKDAKEKFLGQFEKEYLIFHLKLNNGNVARTAQRTGIYGANLYDKLRRYEIDPNQFRPQSEACNVVPLNAQHVA